MALWLIRAGKYGEHEQRFFADSACYLTWEGTEDRDLQKVKDYEGIKALLAELGDVPSRVERWAGDGS
jgi:restriction system protein